MNLPTEHLDSLTRLAGRNIRQIHRLQRQLAELEQEQNLLFLMAAEALQAPVENLRYDAVLQAWKLVPPAPSEPQETGHE